MRSIGAHLMLPETPPVLPESAAPEGWPLAPPVSLTVPGLGTAGASVRSVSRSSPAAWTLDEAADNSAAKARVFKEWICMAETPRGLGSVLFTNMTAACNEPQRQDSRFAFRPWDGGILLRSL